MRLSIAMATHNGERFLQEQLESIAAQDLPPYELIVCDDASQDGTVTTIRRFAAKAPFTVALEINPRNLGSSETFGSVIARCSGDIVVLADQDDVWLPHKLRSIVNSFQRDPHLGLVFSDALLVNEQRQRLGQTLWQSIQFQFGPETNSSSNLFKELVRRNIVTGAAMAFRRDYVNLALPIQPGWVHDGWIAILVSALAPIAAIEQPLIEYRQHSRQQIGAGLSFLKRMRRAVKLKSDDYAHEAQLYRAVKERLISRAMNPQDWVVALLDEKVRHLECRACSSVPYQKRLVSVSRELLSGNYHRFSFGVISALKDLLP